MKFDENMLAAIAALGSHIMDIAAQCEVDRNAKIDLMQKVCSLECELEAARDKIKAAKHLLDASAGAGVDSWAAALKETLR